MSAKELGVLFIVLLGPILVPLLCLAPVLFPGLGAWVLVPIFLILVVWSGAFLYALFHMYEP